jgi:hypothetical protein
MNRSVLNNLAQGPWASNLLRETIENVHSDFDLEDGLIIIAAHIAEQLESRGRGGVAIVLMRMHGSSRQLQLTRRWKVYNDMYTPILTRENIHENLKGPVVNQIERLVFEFSIERNGSPSKAQSIQRRCHEKYGLLSSEGLEDVVEGPKSSWEATLTEMRQV